MKFAAVFAALAAQAIVAVAAEEKVVTLTEANFESIMKENEYVLVEFYAPWCGHCKSLAPEYEKAAAKLDGQEPKVVLAKVDATQEEALAKQFEVQGFPTLKWFVNGSPKEYTGGRTEDTIVSWITKKVGDAATKITDAEHLDTLKADHKVLVVGAFAEEADAAAFLKAAADEEEVAYAVTVGDAAVAKAAGVEGNGIVVFKQFDAENPAVYGGDATDQEAIATFVSGNSLPLIVEFTQENAPKIFGGKIKSHMLIFVDGDDKATKDDVVAKATPVAEAEKGNLLFVTVDKSDERILEFFGLTAEDLPTVRIVNMGEGAMKKYAFEGEITTEALQKMTTDYKDGKLTVQLKSDEIPEQTEDVFVLVGKQFNEIVNKPGVNVLVEFYAPWCGHCKKLAPIYDELAAKYKGNDNIIIAKMDSTANEVESVQVQGFPTIKFFPADSEEVVDYEGGRDLEGFVAFLEEKIPELKAEE
jgi:protein disulfide-isomerase A1